MRTSRVGARLGRSSNVPILDAERETASEWVDRQLATPASTGVHRPGSWARLRRLIERARENGMVLTVPGADEDTAIYTRADDEIWQVQTEEDGVTAVRWSQPPEWSVEEPPRMVLAFNKCADFLR